MPNQNLATTVVIDAPSPVNPSSRSPIWRYLFLGVIGSAILIGGGLAGWLLYERLFATQRFSLNTQPAADLVSPSPMPIDFTNGRLKFSLTVPVGWTIQPAGHDPAQASSAEAAQVVELYDTVLGLDRAFISITGVNGIPAEDQGRLTQGEYAVYPAQMYEVTNSLGTQDRVYYLTHPVGYQLRVLARSNGQPEVEQALSQIERSFVMTE
ncbi:MAG TPA: hypothetical protein VF209_04670 [Patescibacteria group bacterium]